MPRFTRFLLIAMMLVLLPLRGWAGNGMAINSVVSRAAMAAVPSDMANLTKLSVMPEDCAMHSQPSVGDRTNHCSSCDTCELCLAVVHQTSLAWSVSQPLQHSSPPTLVASFSSAASASNLKPPIF